MSFISTFKIFSQAPLYMGPITASNYYLYFLIVLCIINIYTCIVLNKYVGLVIGVFCILATLERAL